MKKTILNLYKKIFKMSCPCCNNNLDSSFLDIFSRFFKFISLQEKYSKNRIIICPKCRSKIVINDNRFSELLFRTMIMLVFIIFIFASSDLYIQFKQYRFIYLTFLVAMFIYVGLTRKIRKLE